MSSLLKFYRYKSFKKLYIIRGKIDEAKIEILCNMVNYQKYLYKYKLIKKGFVRLSNTPSDFFLKFYSHMHLYSQKNYNFN